MPESRYGLKIEIFVNTSEEYNGRKNYRFFNVKISVLE
jgi:hypothetical protein